MANKRKPFHITWSEMDQFTVMAEGNFQGGDFFQDS